MRACLAGFPRARSQVTDVFVADAMRNYLDVLEDAEMPDKDLKPYVKFMSEPKQ